MSAALVPAQAQVPIPVLAQVPIPVLALALVQELELSLEVFEEEMAALPHQPDQTQPSYY